MSRGVYNQFCERLNISDRLACPDSRQTGQRQHPCHRPANWRKRCHATLHNFLRGLSQTLDAENVIKISHWLNIDAAAALMGMGHKEIAELLRTPEPQIKDRHVRAFSKEMSDLTEYERDAILRNVHTIAQTLRETRAHYAVKENGAKMIGG